MYLLKQGLFYIVCEFFVVCNYYTHKNCKMFAMVNCKETSSYVDSAQVCVCVCVWLHGTLVTLLLLLFQNASAQHDHHWIEGNLPKGKCEVCMKSITSDQCLHGQKCTWCGITVRNKSSCC